jgi:hypothetical protein
LIFIGWPVTNDPQDLVVYGFRPFFIFGAKYEEVNPYSKIRVIVLPDELFKNLAAPTLP